MRVSRDLRRCFPAYQVQRRARPRRSRFRPLTLPPGVVGVRGPFIVVVHPFTAGGFWRPVVFTVLGRNLVIFLRGDGRLETSVHARRRTRMGWKQVPVSTPRSAVLNEKACIAVISGKRGQYTVCGS